METKIKFSEEISTGDEVHHLPSDEKWIVAFNENGKLSPCGWPESLAETKDCVLIKKATDEKRIELEQRLLELPSFDIRAIWARRNIKKI